MRVVRPTRNPQTQGYSAAHRAYDHAGLNLPDEVRAGDDGEILARVDLFNTNWTNTGTLTTRDYGNYIIIRHVGGTFELHAHLKLGSSLVTGTKVKAGQVVARIGNTGNSTGPHLHSEYRSSANANVTVEFIDAPTVEQPMEPNNEASRWRELIKDNPYGWSEPSHVKKTIEDLKNELTKVNAAVDRKDQEILVLKTQGKTDLAKCDLDCKNELEKQRTNMTMDFGRERESLLKEIEALKKSGPVKEVEVPKVYVSGLSKFLLAIADYFDKQNEKIK